MSRTKFINFEAIGDLIPDGAVVSVSSSSGLGCPDMTLKAIGQYFEENRSPRNLTMVHPIAAGDMYGIGGIDYLAQPHLLKRIIAGSYPSGPSSMPSPKIWRMINENQVEAYNIPSGLLFHLHRETAALRPGILTTVGLDTFLDPRRQGGKMNSVTKEDLVQLVEFDGREWLYLRSIPINVAIIRGTTADEWGNISMEHEGGYLGGYDQALAARASGGIVIAQVKRLAAAHSLSPQMVRVPGTLVDYIVVDPNQLQTTQTIYDPAISGELRQPINSFETVEWGTDKIIARRAAMEVCREDVVNLGFGISALVPRILLEEGLTDEVTWVIEQGAVGGMPLLGFQFGCAVNAQAIVPASDQFTYFQSGSFNRTMLSFMQVDQYGNVNVSRLASRPHVTAGVGGFIDITGRARNIIFSGYFTAGGLELDLSNGQLRIVKEGRSRKFSEEVEHVTFSGRRARVQGQNVLYITERCVIRLEEEGLVVVEIAPGIDLERDVLAQADFPLKVSHELRQMDERLFRPELMKLDLLG